MLIIFDEDDPPIIDFDKDNKEEKPQKN